MTPTLYTPSTEKICMRAIEAPPGPGADKVLISGNRQLSSSFIFDALLRSGLYWVVKSAGHMSVLHLPLLTGMLEFFLAELVVMTF